MKTIELFKNDLWGGIWEHAKKIFKPIAIITIVYTVLSFVATYFGLSALLGEELMKLISEVRNTRDPEVIGEFSEEFRIYLSGNPSFFAIVPVLIIIGTVVSAWIMNLNLVVSQSILKTGSVDLGQTIARSFNGKVLRTALYFLVVGVVGFIAAFFTVMLIDLLSSLFLGMILMFIVGLIVLRFVAGPAAIVIGDYSLSEALAFSWGNITFKRSLKLFLVGIVYGIILGLAMLALVSILGLIGLDLNVQQLISDLVSNIATYALIAAGLTAAYYRYTDADLDIDQPESDHLIEDL